MPAYYDVSIAHTTNGAAGSLSSGHVVKLLSGTGVNAMVKGYYVGARAGTAGGGQMRVVTCATAATSNGTTSAGQKRSPNFPTATTSAMSNGTTCGDTPTTRISVGFAQTGGMGGWVAIEPDAALMLVAGGGANGNAEWKSIANAASIATDITVEFSEQ